ncbi:MAG: hypothetical protein CL484_11830 [Acidobacteria bacterium]|nr:hypothetical protein [Acidobacteriota bacterium]
MDDVVNRLSKELAKAMATALANDRSVEACHERARVAGYSMQLSLEAVIGFASRGDCQASSQGSKASASDGQSAQLMNSNDRRFLRSLRIAADERTE